MFVRSDDDNRWDRSDESLFCGRSVQRLRYLGCRTLVLTIDQPESSIRRIVVVCLAIIVVLRRTSSTGWERLRSVQTPSNGSVVEVFNVTRGTTIARNVTVARSMLSRARGLMFRTSLPPDAGMLIDPCSSIHMFFMRFAIDVLYVDRENRVVRTQREINPWRVGPIHTRGAKYVIELPVGSIQASTSQVGDQLRVSERRTETP